jgi:hypothetical protein
VCESYHQKCFHFPHLPTQLTLRSSWSTGRLCLCREVDLLTDCATLCNSVPLTATLCYFAIHFHSVPLYSVPLTATHFHSFPLCLSFPLCYSLPVCATVCHSCRDSLPSVSARCLCCQALVVFVPTCAACLAKLWWLTHRSFTAQAMSMHMCPVRRALSTSTLSAQPNTGV